MPPVPLYHRNDIGGLGVLTYPWYYLGMKCLHCSTTFKVQPYRLKTAKFCSRLCHNRNNAEKNIGTHHSPETRLKISKATNRKTPMKCETCDVDFMIMPCEKGLRKYCSWPCYWESKIGQSSWNKGKKLSPSHLFNISGPNANNWQGGKSSEAQIIRHRKEYRLFREAVFKRDDWTCQECSERGGVLNVHHIKPFSLFPELRFAIDNGVTLCFSCHTKTPSFGGKIKSLNLHSI